MRVLPLSHLRVCARLHESVATPIFFCKYAGLDVLEVIGTLDVFAACFAYSTATHSFVQRPDTAPRGATYLSVRLLQPPGMPSSCTAPRPCNSWRSACGCTLSGPVRSQVMHWALGTSLCMTASCVRAAACECWQHGQCGPPSPSPTQALTVDAVAAAARSHGLALLPALVNAVYKFLTRRITALSQAGKPSAA